MTRRNDRPATDRPVTERPVTDVGGISGEHDATLLAAMAELTPDPDEAARGLRARLDGWRDHPLCAPAAMPDAFWGPERLDPAAFGDLIELLDRGAEIAAVLRALAGATDAVDVGGGTGALARAVAARGPVVVVEPSAAQRAQLPPSLVALDGRAEALPIGDGGADAAYAAWVLQYTDDPIAAIDELERVARRRVVIVQAAPGNDLVEIYNREADVAGRPRAHHGWLLSHAATRLELAGFKVALEPIAIPLRSPPGGAHRLADIFARLHFAGHAARDAMIRATGGYIDARLAEAGALCDDAVLLTARR